MNQTVTLIVSKCSESLAPETALPAYAGHLCDLGRRFGRPTFIGYAGAYDIGFLQVSTSAEEVSIGGVPNELKGEDFTVARLKRRFGSQSSLGML